ncbi:hypothetical protein J132_10729 [Termitomyces sp. J132]|nr:hypothetical protein C0989_008563 [Termitomyces sp. Mn162]KNZ79308.1 hypothetical protein J132_10729 [Termitomyces sp. J132]
MTGQHGDSLPDHWVTQAKTFLEQLQTVSDENTQSLPNGPRSPIPHPSPHAPSIDSPIAINTSLAMEPLFPKLQPLDPDESPMRIIWIEPKAHAEPDFAQALNSLSYHCFVIPAKLALEVQGMFPNNIWITNGRGGQMSQNQIQKMALDANVEVLAEEWITVLFELLKRTSLFDVKLMTFDDFFDALTTPASSPHWPALHGADLILAWGDLSIDFMGPNNPYGWNAASFNVFFSALLRLAQVTAIWPDPAENITYGNKISYLSDAAAVARHHGYETPAIFVVDNPEELNTLAPGRIYKRGYSDCSAHVFFSGRPDLDKKSMGTVEAMRAAVKVGQESYAGVDGGLGAIVPQWFTMPYLDSVNNKFGELRVIFVSGKVTHTTATTGLGFIGCSEVRNVTPLHKLMNELSDEPMNVWEAEEARRRFEQFATDMLIGLIEIREKRDKRPSDLRLFARLDIAVYRHPDQTWRYFLSEVEAGVSTVLFLREDTQCLIERVLVSSLCDNFFTKARMRRKNLLV